MKRMTWSFPAGFLHSFEVARPFDGPKFDGLRWLGLAVGDEKKEEEKDFHARGSLRNQAYSLQVIFTNQETGG